MANPLEATAQKLADFTETVIMEWTKTCIKAKEEEFVDTLRDLRKDIEALVIPNGDDRGVLLKFANRHDPRCDLAQALCELHEKINNLIRDYNAIP